MKADDWARVLPNIGRSARIPRIIHQTYTSSALPEKFRKNVDYLIDQNPGWDHRLYDEASRIKFISKHYGPMVLSSYNRINPEYYAARADLFRYLALYQLGGVYLDLKSRFTRPIDDVVCGDEQYIISRWSNGKGEKYEHFGLHPELSLGHGGELQQWHVIAAPGHPFLRAVIAAVLANIDEYRPWRHGVGKLGVLRLTGPIVYTLTITSLLDQYPCKVVKNESELSLDYSSMGIGYVHRSQYAKLNSPIVSLSPGARWLSKAYLAARSMKHRMRQP